MTSAEALSFDRLQQLRVLITPLKHRSHCDRTIHIPTNAAQIDRAVLIPIPLSLSQPPNSYHALDYTNLAATLQIIGSLTVVEAKAKPLLPLRFVREFVLETDYRLRREMTFDLWFI